ncbi:MAG: hypothetical protein ACW97A_06485 [Candidatus Thorarchaeota archaeon]
MSNGVAVRIALGIFLTFIISIASILWMFEWIGISEFVFPILLPIFGYTILIMFVITSVIFVAVRRSQNLISTATWSQRGYTSQSLQPSAIDFRPVYIIPMKCPGCDRELELSQVEWRDKFTIVCPSCFSDVNVQTSSKI